MDDVRLMGLSVKPRPSFSAMEVQQAYILASLNWLQQTKSLNPNHEVVEKAKKLRQLGFTNSRVINEAAKSEAEIERLKCYSFFQQNFPGCIILDEQEFVKLNLKYGLVCGRLGAYKGDVPNENLDEILATKRTLTKLLKDNPYSNKCTDGDKVRLINKVTAKTEMRTLGNYPYFSSFEEPHPKGVDFTLLKKTDINAYPFKHHVSKMRNADYVNIGGYDCESYELFIAAPADDMSEAIAFTVPERRVIPMNLDPFVFQVTPVGVVIYSKWGVEAEDDIFETIKPL